MPGYFDFFLRIMIFAIIHSVLASTRVKLLIHRLVGERFRAYRFLYNLVSAAIFGWAMSAYRHSPVIYFVPGIWSLVMYLLQFIIAATLVKCLQQTGATDFLGIRQLQNTQQTEHLITDGFYAVVRHPLYLLSILFLILNPVMTTQWLILTLFSCLYFVIGALIEEKRLLAVFGYEYSLYKRRVPFLFPHFNFAKSKYS